MILSSERDKKHKIMQIRNSENIIQLPNIPQVTNHEERNLKILKTNYTYD